MRRVRLSINSPNDLGRKREDEREEKGEEQGERVQVRQDCARPHKSLVYGTKEK